MTLVSIFTGIFAIAEAVPILRDAFHSAVSMYYAKKIAESTKERKDAIDELNKAKSVQEIQNAVGRIVRARAD